MGSKTLPIELIVAGRVHTALSTAGPYCGFCGSLYHARYRALSVLETVTATITATGTASSTSRAKSQGGIFEHGNPSVYDPSNPLTVFIIQAGIIIIFCRLLHYPLSRLRQLANHGGPPVAASSLSHPSTFRDAFRGTEHR